MVYCNFFFFFFGWANLFLLKFILVHFGLHYFKKKYLMEISVGNCCPSQLCKYRVITENNQAITRVN